MSTNASPLATPGQKKPLPNQTGAVPPPPPSQAQQQQTQRILGPQQEPSPQNAQQALQQQRQGEQMGGNNAPVRTPVKNTNVQRFEQNFQNVPLAPTDPTQLNINGHDHGYLTGATPDYSQAYIKPPVGYQEQQSPENLPNYDKLTSGERLIMSLLPGASNVTKAVQQWDTEYLAGWGGWTLNGMGKALSILQWPVENIVKRPIGIASQYLMAAGNPAQTQELNDNFKAAWAASSLSFEYANLPEIEVDQNGLRFINPQSLPGIDGMISARKKIADLMMGGMDAEAALSKVREEQSVGQGALQLRSQLQELTLSIAGDPLNIIMPILKPVERVQAYSKWINAAKTSESALVDITHTAEASQSALTVAEDALKTAQLTNDAEAIAKATEGMNAAQKSAEAAGFAASEAKLSKMNSAERFVVWATGGEEGLQREGVFKTFGKLVKGEANLGDVGNELRYSKFNPLALSPEARAEYLRDTVMENANSRLAPAVQNPDGTYRIDEFARHIQAAKDGTITPALGHMVVTPEGRLVKDVLSKANQEVTAVASAYATGQEFAAPLLKQMSSALGISDFELMSRFNAGEAKSIFAQFGQKLTETPELGQLFGEFIGQKGLTLDQWTPELMGANLHMFTGELAGMFDSRVAMYTMMNKIADVAAQDAVLRYGVGHRNFIQAVSDLTKSAETLAFLKANPAYPVKNFINNYFTMVARGAWGTMTEAELSTFWKGQGFIPNRLLSAFGPAGDELLSHNSENFLEKLAAGDIAATTTHSDEIINEATRSTHGWLNKITNAIKGVGFGPLDMGQVAQKTEQSSSLRAYTTGYANYLNDYAQVPKLAEYSPELAKTLGDSLVKDIQNTVKSSGLNEAKLESMIAGENLRLNWSNVQTAVEQKLGKPLSSVFSSEFSASVSDGLETAMRSGDPGEVTKFIDGIHEKVIQHIEEQSDNALEMAAHEAAAKVKAEGPGAFVDVVSNSMDEFWGAHEKHAMDISQAIENIDRGMPPEAVNAEWKNIQAKGDAYWNRTWKRLEANMNGMMSGASDLGFTQVEEVNGTLAKWKSGWQDFYSVRNEEWGAHFDSLAKGETPLKSAEQIHFELDAAYQDAIKGETATMRQVDSLVGGMLPDEQKHLYAAWRDRVNELRLADKQTVMDFRNKLKTIPVAEQGKAYTAHWQERIQNWNRIYQEERAGKAAVFGNLQARGNYVGPAAQDAQLESLAQLASDKKLGGVQITPEEQAALDKYIQQKDPATASYLDGLKKQLDEVKAQPKVSVTDENGTPLPTEVQQAPIEPVKPAAPLTMQEKLARMDAIKANATPAEAAKLKALSQAETVAPLDITKVPRSQLPETLSREIEFTAKRMQEELAMGESPLTTKNGEGAFTRTKSTNPKWMQDYLSEYSSSKKKILDALDKIVRDHGDDKGLTVERLKQIMREQMGEVDPLTGEPPNPEIVKMLQAQTGEAAQLDRAQQMRALEEEIYQRSKQPFTPKTEPVSKKYKMNVQAMQAEVDRLDESLVNAKGRRQQLVDQAKAAGQDIHGANNYGVPYAEEQKTIRGISMQRSGYKKEIEALSAQVVSPAKLEPTLPVDTASPNYAAELEQEIATTEKQVIDKLKGTSGDGTPSTQAAHVPDFETIVTPELYTATGTDQLYHNQGERIINSMRDSAHSLMADPPLKYGELPPNVQQDLRGYFDHAKASFSDTRYAASRFGEYTRDSALLNYKRRFNYNNWLGTMMPYEFWVTQSAWKWALHSIDRPAMLSTYLRLKKFLETAYRPEQGLPSRLNGTVRIPLPFMPDWLGKSMFIDPLNTALPFEGFARPWEEYWKQAHGDVGSTNRKLQELLNDGQINQQEFDQASRAQSGPVWERANTLMQQDDAETRLNPWDLATMMSAPHAPVQWAIDHAQNRETGAVLPITNTIGATANALGIDPSGWYNPEAAIRKALGFHPFNKWDDYYIDRALSNLAADGKFSAKEVRQAMIQRSGPAFAEATKRAYDEKYLGAPGLISNLLALPAKSYPQGEEHLRQLQDDYNAAWTEYNQTADYNSTVGAFNKAHPEYEARLALFDKPDVRLKKFLRDEFWSKWNTLPKLTKDEVTTQLGNDFKTKLIDKETRNMDGVTSDQLQLWTQLIGGDTPYKLDSAQPLDLTAPDVAQRVQSFYNTREHMFGSWVYDQQKEYFNIPDTAPRINVAPPAVADYIKQRDQQFPGIFNLQNQYYALPAGGARKDFRNQHPEMAAYWTFERNWKAANPDAAAYLAGPAPITISAKTQYLNQHPGLKTYFKWRDDYLKRNPETAPYVSDNPKYKTEQWTQAVQQQQGQPQMSWDEWKIELGGALTNIVLDTTSGHPLPEVAKKKLQAEADKLGWQGDLDSFAKYITESR